MKNQTIDNVLRNLAEHDPDFYMDCDNGFSAELQSLMHDPGLILLSGLPEMGCTSLALNTALCLAKHHGKTVLYFTFDTSREAIIRRLLCMEALVDADSLRDKFLDDAQWIRISTAAKILKSIPLHIFDDPLLTVGEIAQICDTYNDIGLIVMDSLQRVQHIPGEKRTRKENRVLSKLSDLATRKNLPIMCLNTLGEELENGLGDNSVWNKDVVAFEEDGRHYIFAYHPNWGYRNRGYEDKVISVLKEHL